MKSAERQSVGIAALAGLALIFGAAPLLSQEELEPLVVEAEESVSAEPEAAPSDEAANASAAAIEAASEDEPQSDDPLDERLRLLRKERDLLSLKNSIRSQEVQAELRALREEKERLTLENAVFREKLNAELAQTNAKISRLDARLNALNKSMAVETAEMKKALQAELADLRKQEERLAAENAVISRETEQEMARLRLAEAKLKTERATLETEVAKLQAKLAIKEKSDMVEDQIYGEDAARYMKDPFVDGTLYVSDRRIALDGPITSATASHVSDRINFFNNQTTEYPIFLVIGSSPGGSVMSGYHILKSMDGSKAPVHVVVKSYAASMAATIAALAERSFAYPNAVILHHQMSWGGSGNLTQHREFLEEAEEWWRRLARPVAEKMGLTLDEFIALMYEKNSEGNWREFADTAVKYEWVDHVVDQVWETAIDRNPDRYGQTIWATSQVEEKVDDKGRAYVPLPRLEPFDFYYLYNPDGYYRLAE